ncbi:MAG: bifunctional 3,4-dihydroxy-2-butanone-4-phosphate synthase/GTP cyclohydrolase II [Candidatus Lambdaproteobacteria bacterium]|nr:bifunctional 3,4-dihydroxy-2-butanone-4-phosphate synthase/GTP cyclohydrolase II [Candidatus Lambdaproteobacteria bacterium]
MPTKSTPTAEPLRFDSIAEAIEDFGAGRMVILVDDEDRENEGDLVCAAEKVTPELINYMARHGRGLICLALHPDIVDQLRLPQMVEHNSSPFGTNFTVSIEASAGVTTGISAADRACTILAAVNPQARPEDVVTPGHIFPLRAKRGGVLVRAGQTEGSVDLATLAGLRPAGVVCEIMDEDGSMARYPRLRQFADQEGLKLVTIADLIAYRKAREVLVKRMAEAALPTEFGRFRVVGYQNAHTDDDYVALVAGSWAPEEPILVRVHSQCLTGDVFHSKRCDCGPQLHAAMQMVAEAGKGVILYLPQEGRGIGLINKIKAYRLQETGSDTVEANHRLGFKEDLRDYGIGAQILTDLGVRKMRLLTNNPRKIVGLGGHALEVVERVPLQISPSTENRSYLLAKKNKLGHLLNLDS